MHLFCYHDSKKAMLAKDVALIHGRPVKAINQAINMNRNRFRDGIDIIDLKQESGSIKLTMLMMKTSCPVNSTGQVKTEN